MPERYFTKAAVVVAHQIFLFFIYCSITVTYCSLKQKRARGHYCEILPTKHWCGSSNTVFIDFQVTSCNISNFIYIMLGRGREKNPYSLFLLINDKMAENPVRWLTSYGALKLVWCIKSKSQLIFQSQTNYVHRNCSHSNFSLLVLLHENNQETYSTLHWAPKDNNCGQKKNLS